MRVFRSLAELRARQDAGSEAPRSAVAIGKFDGVHLGHRAIIERLRSAARERGLEAVVFTFEENPLRLLNPERCPPPLMSVAQREEMLEELGVDACVMVPFDRELSTLDAEEYVRAILVGALGAKHLIVGSDFRFGNRGRGDAALLRSLGDELGFTVEEVPSVIDDELGRVSSTRVREALAQGEVEVAARMLGRCVGVRGEVVRGDARGRELGFPTANLGGEVEGLVPEDGVYAGRVALRGRLHDAAISVGTNPTFTPEGQSRVEAFILDFSGDIYGERIEVFFVSRIRGTYTFAGVDELVERMGEDVRETRRILSAATA